MSDSYKRRGLRRRRPVFDAEGDAWLVTYSDAITLLLAFFVMILSVSDINQGKVEVLKEGIAGLFADTKPQTPFTDIKNNLEDVIAAHQMQGNVTVALDPKGIKVEFANFALYESGAASIKPEALPILEQVTSVIDGGSEDSYLIEVEGHTDDVPIKTAEFPSNWELSAARASNVVKYMITQGIDKSRLKASGFADSRPKADPLKSALPLEQQRAENRRVVIFVKRY